MFDETHRKHTSRRKAMIRSVLIVRSCTSSTTTHVYAFRSGSRLSSFRRTRSVTKHMTVLDELLREPPTCTHVYAHVPIHVLTHVHTHVCMLGKPTWKPTSSPRLQPNSSATRSASDVAASLRGCVHAMQGCAPRMPESMSSGIACVDLPEPVALMRTTTYIHVNTHVDMHSIR